MRIALDDAIVIAEKIDSGLRDHTTKDSRFTPLWNHPILREAFLRLLRNCEAGASEPEERHSFEILCDYLEPDFAEVLEVIDLPSRMWAADRLEVETATTI